MKIWEESRHQVPPCQTMLSFLLWSAYISFISCCVVFQVLQWDTTIWLLREGATRWPKSIAQIWTLHKSANQHSAFARGRQRENELGKVTSSLGPQNQPSGRINQLSRSSEARSWFETLSEPIGGLAPLASHGVRLANWSWPLPTQCIAWLVSNDVTFQGKHQSSLMSV